MTLEIRGGKPINTGVLNALKEIKPFERVMIFIDGGYLRELCKELKGHDHIDFGKLSWTFIRMFNTISTNPFQANLIRIYYYDAIVDKSHSDYETQKQYFDSIDDQYAYTVRLGQLVKSSKKVFKQKGVDILMAIDAISKAYTNQYDAAIFMIGDRDFIPLIDAVKDAGKKTICVYYPRESSKDLIRTFDVRISFDEKAVDSWLKKTK